MGEKKEVKKRGFLKKLKEKAEAFANKSKYAVIGVGHCLSRPKYAIACVLAFVVFLYLLTFFRDGSGRWQLLCAGKINQLWINFLSMMSNFASLYGVLLVFMSALQAIAVAQIIYTWRNRRKDEAINGVERGGIASLLGFAALGCPSCGVSIFMPILTAVVGTGASIIAERISIIIAIIAFLLLIYANISLGYIVFIIAGNSKKRKEK